ncbi:anti-sigma factor domain-containing protein [Planococcus koreensis]|uniref:anti-sigma factor domain-containing protein n=1 Tax=Planococcus koreensis TaxID=112331 RepID=UPI0039FBC352
MTKMNCDHVIDYLNGTLTEEEMREFQLHLNSCEDCRELVEAVGELPYLAEAAEPPAGMKARILANVFDESHQQEPVKEETIKAQEPSIEAAQPATKPAPKVVPMVKPPKERVWWRPMIAAVLLVSLLGNAYALMQLSDDDGDGGAQTEAAFQSIDLQASESFGGTAKAALVREGDSLEVVVQGEGLQALSGSEVYQIWLLKDGQPIPAGAFEADAGGQGAAFYQLEQNTEEWDTIAITLEPEAGNELPEGEIVLSAGL